MNPELHPVIGIDLGTTYSAVAVYNNGTFTAEVLSNPQSETPGDTTPSVISRVGGMMMPSW